MSDTRLEDSAVSRIAFFQEAGETVAAVRPARSLFAMAFLIVRLGGRTVSGVSVFRQFIGGNTEPNARLFLGLWLCAWAAGEVFVVGALLWWALGKEVIAASMTSLKHAYRLPFRSRTRNDRPASVADLRWRPGTGTPHAEGTTPSRIAFEYGPKTILIAKGCDEGGGNKIIPWVITRIGEKSRAGWGR